MSGYNINYEEKKVSYMVNKSKKAEKKKLQKPNLPIQQLKRGLPAESLQDREYYAQLALAHADFSGQVVSRISFDRVLFEQVRMGNTQFKGVQLIDTRIAGGDLANAQWTEVNFHRVELISCHLTGFQANEAQLQDVLFKECAGHFAQWAFTTFDAVRFEDCDLSEANFYQANLTGVIFVNCDLSHADFSGAKLAGADLRGCKIEGIRIGPQELRGATIDPAQALALVQGMGIAIKSIEESL